MKFKTRVFENYPHSERPKIHTAKFRRKAHEPEESTPRSKSAYTQIEICLYPDSNLPTLRFKSAYTQIQICLYPDSNLPIP
jgi:allantoicase